jgi:type VI secretion system protein ImpG
VPRTFAEYYDQEARYLAEAAHEFAEKHPDRAAFLRLESKDRDPYVERLLEGFAFLAARVRQKLDDEYPEFTRGLLEVLLPHYLRPIPSMAMLQFLPRRGALQETQIVKRATPVSSPATGSEGVSCRFSTAKSVRLNPVFLEEATLEHTPKGENILRLRFQLDRGVDPRRLALDPLPIYLHGDATLANTLHLFLTRHTPRVVLRPAGGPARTLGGGEPPIRPSGFAEDEALLPYSLRSFPAFRYLQEYCAFRERFLGVEITGIQPAHFEATTKSFDLECHWDRAYPEERRFTPENFRLHCAPIVNLFLADMEPLRLSRYSAEFRVLPDTRFVRGIEVYSIESVVGATERGRRAYEPFHEFEQPAGEPGALRPGTYVATQRMGETGRWNTHLRVSRSEDGRREAADEVLSIQAWCTNGQVPHDLAERSIEIPGPDFPEYAQFTNLTRPTPVMYPPDGMQMEWSLVAHLALNHTSISSADALRHLLELYDWAATPAIRRRIAGIRSVRIEPREELLRGLPIRGSHVRLELDESHFLDKGDAHLFGMVLSRFFDLYATVNSFAHTTVTMVPSGETHEWKPDRGVVELI